MSIFDCFPRSNAYQINLDWLLKSMRELETYVKNYTAVNSVAYAGIWDITKQYPRWALVSTDDSTYLSLKPVPSGVPIENAEYWEKLADLDPRIAGIIADIEKINNELETFKDSPIIDATKYGVSAASDIGVSLSQVISEHPGSIIILPEGYYTCETSIIMEDNNTLLYCVGDIKSSAPVTFNIMASHVYLFINHATGDGTNTCLQYGDLTMEESYGNSTIEINSIDNFAKGVSYVANGNNGIQNVVLKYSRINRSAVGIELKCGDKSTPWINQNTFNCGWISGEKEGTTGIKFVKGANQTDRFNGNVFNEFSCENTTYPIDLQYAWNNAFNNFRMVENVGENLIKLDKDCESNTFIGASAWVNYKHINDAGINNEYQMTLHDDDGINICTAATFVLGNLVPMGMIFTNRTFSTDRGVGIPETISPELIVFDGTTYNVNVVLPSGFSRSETAKPFYLKIGAKNGTAEVITYGGTVLANDTNGGTSGTVLEANSLYLFVPTIYGEYEVIKL